MKKENRNILIGIAFGFMGMILYYCMLDGFEYLKFSDVWNYIKQGIIPFIFTEVLAAIGLGAFESFKKSIIEFKNKRDNKTVIENAEA